MSTTRTLEEVLQAQPASDGDGVKLKRVFGGNNLERFDPFLMLDEFGSDEAADYIGGFPSHPHRGFETVTYMLEGFMEHRDHMENVGKLGPGDVQWMKAGSGVIHSEMPQQEAGRMHGFQLWVNLPAGEKMSPASYNELSATDIPAYALGTVTVKAIAGDLQVNDQPVPGAVQGLSTEPAYLDIHASSAQRLNIEIPDGHNLLVYIYQGSARVVGTDYLLDAGKMGRLSHFGGLEIEVESDTRLLVISGKPIAEPIVHYGPFVMNSMEEIEQAIQDFQSGSLVAERV